MKKMRKYKVKRSGNIHITTVPPEVKEYIGVKTGETISYIFQTDGIVKAQEELGIDSIVNSVINHK